MADLYVALLHYPVYDKRHDVVTTAVTTLDVHDIARSCTTYGAAAFYVVTPVDAHRALARKIMRHWQDGPGATYNETRKVALERVRLVRTLEDVEIDIEAATGRLPVLVATSAKRLDRPCTYESLRRELGKAAEPYLLLLGTGWGLTTEIIERAARRLPPISGRTAYNHLSVRAAAGIVLDRLLGTR